MNNNNLINLYSCMKDYNNVFRDDIKAEDLHDMYITLDEKDIDIHYIVLDIKYDRELLLNSENKYFIHSYLNNLNKNREIFYLLYDKRIDENLNNKIVDYIKDTYLKTEDLIEKNLNEKIYYRSEIELINQISLKHKELKNLELVVAKTRNYEKVIDSYNIILEYHDFLKNHINNLEPSSETSKLATAIEKMDEKINSNLENFKQKHNLEPNFDFDR